MNKWHFLSLLFLRCGHTNKRIFCQREVRENVIQKSWRKTAQKHTRKSGLVKSLFSCTLQRFPPCYFDNLRSGEWVREAVVGISEQNFWKNTIWLKHGPIPASPLPIGGNVSIRKAMPKSKCQSFFLSKLLYFSFSHFALCLFSEHFFSVFLCCLFKLLEYG